MTGLRLALSVALLGLLFSGCASILRWDKDTAQSARSSPPEPERREASVSEVQHELEAQITRISRELSGLQNALARLMAGKRHQDDRLEVLERRLGQLADQVREARRAALPTPGPPQPVPPLPLAPSGPSPAATPAEDLYQSGLAKFQAGEPEAAMVDLYDLIANYPTHQFRESAQLLVADILYSQKDFQGALAEFNDLLATAPNGRNHSDLLVKIGLCQREMGDEALARKTWERVVEEDPESPAARQARVLLRELRERSSTLTPPLSLEGRGSLLISFSVEGRGGLGVSLSVEA
ncbi:MAG: tol-pal system YbgF family protein [Candidatus Methylomirabilia bacterium]